MKQSFKLGKAQINVIAFQHGWIQGFCDLAVNAFIFITFITVISIFKGDFGVMVKYLLYSGAFVVFMISLLWLQAKLESRKNKQ